MLQPRFSVPLVAVLLLTIAVIGCHSEPVPEAPQPATTDAGTEARVLALLTVNHDGTVAITNEVQMAALLGSSWPGARSELTSLNRRIRSGQVRPFLTSEDLTHYTRSQPSYQPTADQTGEVIFTEASDPPDPKNPQCREKCPASELCCCGGFWFLCWSVCGCKP